MAVIDVGYNTSQTSTSATDYTIVVYYNPANGTGTIDYLWIKTNGIATVDIASFAEVSAGHFTTNGTALGLVLAINVNELNAPGDFTAFDINEGEYIGAWDYGHHINRGGSGTGVCRYILNDNIPCIDVTFSTYTAYYCVYGTGVTSGSDVDKSIDDSISLSESITTSMSLSTHHTDVTLSDYASANRVVSTDTGLIIIRPTVIVDAMLISSNIPETDYAEWSEATAYTLGQTIIVVDDDITRTVYADYMEAHIADMTNGNAFLRVREGGGGGGIDLTRCVTTDGSTPYKVVLTDTTGKQAIGWAKPATGSNFYGVGDNFLYSPEMCIDPDITSTAYWIEGAGWAATSVLTGTLASSDCELAFLNRTDQVIVKDALYYIVFDIVTCTAGSVAAYIGETSNTTPFTSDTGLPQSVYLNSTQDATRDDTNFGVIGNGFSGTISALSLFRILDPPQPLYGGIRIVSEKDGSIQSWTSIENGFNPNEIATFSIRASVHKVYEALDSTTGDYPGESPTKWLYIGATNRWKVFDHVIQDQTIGVT